MSVGVIAKRGDLFLFSVHHGYTQLHGKSHLYTTYELGRVTSVSREGRVTAWLPAGREAGREIRRTTPTDIMLVSATRIDTLKAQDAYRARGERSFETVGEAKEFLRPFLK